MDPLVSQRECWENFVAHYQNKNLLMNSIHQRDFEPKFHNSNDPADNQSQDWPVCMRTIDYHVNPSNKNHSYHLDQGEIRLHNSETTSCQQQTIVQVHALALFHSAGYLNQSY